MYHYVIGGLLSGISGGIIFFVGEDMYNIYILKNQRYVRSYSSITQLLNPGLTLGVLLGLYRAHLGEPIIDYYFK